MSWKEAVQSVVDEMLAEVEDLKENQDAAYTRSTLKGYARTLKAICASAGDLPTNPIVIQSPNPTPIGAYPFLGVAPELQHHLEVEKARKEFRKSKSTESIEERHDGEQVFAIGGPADSTLCTINAGMPIGARDHFAGAAYQLQVNETSGMKQLVYDEKETERIKLALLARKGGD